MRQRARRSVDMLPLLDVFMVVLFVFATIQEHDLDTSARELEALAAKVGELEAQLVVERERAVAAEARATLLDEQRATAQRQADRTPELDELLAEYRRLCGDAKPGGPLCPAIELDPKTASEQLAVDTLLARLFDNVAVFEVELQGEVDLERGIRRNHCCYRSDPPDGEWKTCGEVPSGADLRLAWVTDGGQGLVDGLRRTRGGNAIVLLRQGERAGYRLTNDLADLLREQLPDHKIYDDGSVASLDCPLLAP